MSRTRLYLTNATSSVLTRVLQATVLVWVNQHLVHRIAPEEYSIFPLVLSLMFFADVFKQILTGGIGRFIVEADSREDHREVTRIVSSIFPVVLIAGFVFVIAGALAIWRIDTLVQVDASYRGQAQAMLSLLVFTFCLNVVTAPFADGGYVRQRFVTLNLIDLGTETLRITLLLFLLFNVGTKVTWLVLASTCASTANVLVRVWLTKRWVPAIRFQRNLFSIVTARKLLRFGGWTSMSAVTALVSSTLPVLLLNRFGTALDVAVFYLGRLPEVQIRLLAGVAAAPAQPALTRIFATEGPKALHALYYRGGRYHLWMTLLLLAPLIVFGQDIVLLYAGQKYGPAATVMACVLAAYPFLWASAMFFQVAHAIGRVGEFYLCDMLVQGTTLLAMLYTVVHLRLGAVGAALAMSLAGAICHVLIIWPMGLRLVQGKWSSFLSQTLWPGILPFVVAVAACFAFRFSVPIHSWLMVCLGSAFALLFYLSALLYVCTDPVDRALLARLNAMIRTLTTWISAAFRFRIARRVWQQ